MISDSKGFDLCICSLFSSFYPSFPVFLSSMSLVDLSYLILWCPIPHFIVKYINHFSFPLCLFYTSFLCSYHRDYTICPYNIKFYNILIYNNLIRIYTIHFSNIKQLCSFTSPFSLLSVSDVGKPYRLSV